MCGYTTVCLMNTLFFGSQMSLLYMTRMIFT